MRIRADRWKPSVHAQRALTAWKRLQLATGPSSDPSPEVFADVDAFCMFIGYPRSGHSLVGSLLDAHPEIMIAHEADVLEMLGQDAGRAEIFRACYLNSLAQARSGRTHSGYSYAVPGQFQGQHETLRVIGDKKGGRSSRRLGEDPDLLDRMLETLGVTPLRLLHVVRNPFDNITRMTIEGRSFEEATALYFEMCETVEVTKTRVAPGVILDVRHEDVIADPTRQLRRLCEFLGVEADAAYLQACADIVFPEPNQTRYSIEWSPEAIARVQTRIDGHPFLAGYTFDS